MGQSGIAGIEIANFVAGWRENPDTASGDYRKKGTRTKDKMTGRKPQKLS
jgi:hypothetical protein